MALSSKLSSEHQFLGLQWSSLLLREESEYEAPMVIECKLCDFLFYHFFSAGSSDLFATSPEEGDLFPTKPASQRKLVRAAIDLHTASNLAFFSPLSFLFLFIPSFLFTSFLRPFLSPSLLPPFPFLSVLTPFLTLSHLFFPFSPSLFFLPASRLLAVGSSTKV